MRRVTLIAACIALGLLPAVDAQLPNERPMVLEAADFEDPLDPLKQPGRTTITVQVPCTHLMWNLAGSDVKFQLVDAPAWTQVVFSPPQLVVPPCESATDDHATASAELLATANDRAPAYRAASVRVQAVASNGQTDDLVAEDEATVTASYFGILEVSAPVSIQRAGAGEKVEFALDLTSLGNGATLVRFVVQANEKNASVAAPAPIVLESRQQGGAAYQRQVTFVVWAPDARGPAPFTLEYTSRHAADPETPGDSGTISFLVTVDGDARDGAAEKAQRLLPGPPAWALALAALAAVAVSRRRPTR